jgi:hypothetical protein
MVYKRAIIAVKLGRKSFYYSAPHPCGSSAAASASRLLDEFRILGLVVVGQGCVCGGFYKSFAHVMRWIMTVF